MNNFLGMFVLGCFITILIKALKGKRVTPGSVLLWGLVFAIFAPLFFTILGLLLGLVWLGFVILGIIALVLLIFWAASKL